MQILRLHLDLLDQKPWGQDPAVCFNKPPSDSNTHYSLQTPSLDVQEMENVIFLIHIALQLVLCAETHRRALFGFV